jgi:hypothetical protein
MFIFKLSLLTCGFYLGFSILMDVIILVLARAKGSFAFGGKPLGWVIWFGAIWLLSFVIAWHLMSRPPTSA